MYRRVFSSYGFLISIVNDQDGQTTSTLWGRLCQRCGINIKFSSAHHPEIDGQTVNANKVMKNYLQAYISHLQDNWIDHLPMAEFAANNHVNTSTGITLFFVDNNFHLCTDIEPSIDQKNNQKAELLAADKIVKNQKIWHNFCRISLLKHSKIKLTGPISIAKHI